MEKSKRCLKVVLITISVIVIITAVLFSVLIYKTSYEVKTVDTSASPDGQYVLLFQSVGEPAFSFGSAPGKLALKKDGKTISTAEFEIANDGGRFTDFNWRVTWLDDRVEILLCGEEMYDKLCLMYFNGRTESRELTTHFGYDDYDAWVDDYYAWLDDRYA